MNIFCPYIIAISLLVSHLNHSYAILEVSDRQRNVGLSGKMLALNGCLVIVYWTVKDYSFAIPNKTKIYSDYDVLGIGTMENLQVAPFFRVVRIRCMLTHQIWGRRTTQ